MSSRPLWSEHNGVVAFIVDDLAAWLIGLLADRARKRLTTALLRSDQERALVSATTAAVRLTARELSPGNDERAENVAMVVRQLFSQSTPEALTVEHQSVLESLQAGIAAQLAVLDDASLTGTGWSSAELLEVPGAVL